MIKELIPKTHNFNNNEKIILRDFLSLERTRLANERTFLSYLRTSLYLIVGGFALLRIEGLENVKWLGYISFLLSCCSIIVGTYKYLDLKKHLHKYYDE